MGSFKFQKLMNDQGQLTGLEIGGVLVLEQSQMLKNEFLAVVNGLNNQLEIKISELEEIDISCIQLIAAFIRVLDHLKIKYQLVWDIDQEQRLLLESIGLSNDFF